MRQCVIYSIQFILTAFFTAQTLMAQSGQLENSTEQQVAAHSHIPKPGFKPDQKFSTRTMQRTGTAIVGARNSVSIKSTDAGIIHTPPIVPAAPYPHHAPNQPQVPPASGCINCGVIDFISIIGQGNALNAMASGIVAGTIAKKIGGHGVFSHPGHRHNHGHGTHSEQTGQHQHYQVGITMHDGSQQTITVPEVSHLHRGDRIQLIDGMIIPEHMDQ